MQTKYLEAQMNFQSNRELRQKQIINKSDMKARNNDHFCEKTSKYEDVNCTKLYNCL